MRGRPVGSKIRENIGIILYVIGESYGYTIHKLYELSFHQVTIESIYYNLKKGLTTGEFELAKVLVEKGAYSWGNEVTKRLYKRGENAPSLSTETLLEDVRLIKEMYEKHCR